MFASFEVGIRASKLVEIIEENIRALLVLFLHL